VDPAPLLSDLTSGGTRWLPHPIGKVRSAATMSASVVMGEPQFDAAALMTREAVSSGLVEELLLGEGSSWPPGKWVRSAWLHRLSPR
jgi:hypothetical protein